MLHPSQSSRCFLCAIWVSLLCPLLATSATYYVSPQGNDNANGSITSPWKTVTKAIESASSGDRIELFGGVYRERIQTHGPAFTDWVTVTAHDLNAPPIIRGSDVVTTWTREGETPIWSCPTANLAFQAGWDLTESGWVPRPIRRTQQVFVDGTPLQMIGLPTLRPMVTGYSLVPIGHDFHDMYPGTFYTDETAEKLYVWLVDGSQPAQHLVEVSVRCETLLSTKSLIRYENITFEHSNSFEELTESSLNSYGRGMIRLEAGGRCELVDCTIRWGDSIGILILDTVSAEIRNCLISNNGWLGVLPIAGGGVDLVRRIADCTVTYNNCRHFISGWGDGGIKVCGSPNGGYVSVVSNHVAWNFGPGIWVDTGNRDGLSSIVIDSNFVHDNQLGVMIEVSKAVKVSNNLLSHNTLYQLYVINSDSTFSWNNTIVGGDYGVVVAADGRTDGAVTYSCVNNQFFNNIVSDFAKWGISIDTERHTVTDGYDCFGNVSDNNMFFRNLSSEGYFVEPGLSVYNSLCDWQARGYDANSIWSAPAFQDNLYRLSSASPAKNVGRAGLWTIQDRDRGGQQRLAGDGVDLGCYEWPGAELVGDTHYVISNNSGTSPYVSPATAASSITAALCVAADGDTVAVGGGNYREGLDLTMFSEVKIRLNENELIVLEP